MCAITFHKNVSHAPNLGEKNCCHIEWTTLISFHQSLILNFPFANACLVHTVFILGL